MNTPPGAADLCWTSILSGDRFRCRYKAVWVFLGEGHRDLYAERVSGLVDVKHIQRVCS